MLWSQLYTSLIKNCQKKLILKICEEKHQQLSRGFYYCNCSITRTYIIFKHLITAPYKISSNFWIPSCNLIPEYNDSLHLTLQNIGSILYSLSSWSFCVDSALGCLNSVNNFRRCISPRALSCGLGVLSACVWLPPDLSIRLNKLDIFQTRSLILKDKTITHWLHRSSGVTYVICTAVSHKWHMAFLHTWPVQIGNWCETFLFKAVFS